MNNTTANLNVHFNQLGTVLTIIFVILKLTGKITWSWLWVLSPIWISFIIAIVAIIIYIILMRN